MIDALLSRASGWVMHSLVCSGMFAQSFLISIYSHVFISELTHLFFHTMSVSRGMSQREPVSGSEWRKTVVLGAYNTVLERELQGDAVARKSSRDLRAFSGR